MKTIKKVTRNAILAISAEYAKREEEKGLNMVEFFGVAAACYVIIQFIKVFAM